MRATAKADRLASKEIIDSTWGVLGLVGPALRSGTLAENVTARLTAWQNALAASHAAQVGALAAQVVRSQTPPRSGRAVFHVRAGPSRFVGVLDVRERLLREHRRHALVMTTPPLERWSDDEALRELVRLAHDLPDFDADEAWRRLGRRTEDQRALVLRALDFSASRPDRLGSFLNAA